MNFDQNNQVTRSPQFWFEDGSVVLQAESTQFRVHFGVLGNYIPFFEGMADSSFPQPEGEPTVEGAPVMTLHDSAEDVKHMLTALYTDRYESENAIPLDAVAAMLRMGDKYMIPYLQHRGRSALVKEFPSKLEEFRKTMFAPGIDCTAGSGISDLNLDQEPGNILKIIRLALRHNLERILPAVLGVPAFKGVKYILRMGNTDPLSPFARGWEGVCLLGRENLFDAYDWQFRWVMGLGVRDSCSSKEQCAEASIRLTHRLWRPKPDVRRMYQSWQSFKAEGTIGNAVGRLCPACMQWANDSFDEAGNAFWSQFPAYFGREPWI
ncbi:hypothetical protein D9611_006479 [Ephemerocybe angulata]|uniref:BTB domain-containing protein n=1 Tax=Ephemerocybe angulata TaxID=980116 RepID=A0A8H5C837_9AGAR|nr:hypothetical protein D9611_006479 [Tulosesus angulatus]